MRSGFRAWAADVNEVMSNNWRHGLLLAAYYAYVGAHLTVTSRIPIGTPVFEREWDLLVVLDACRVDALREVADEYDFLSEVDAMYSVGSTSGEWMVQTFDRRFTDQIATTAMVTANSHTQHVLEDRQLPPQWVAAPLVWPDWDPVGTEAFHHIEKVWTKGWDDDLGTIPPRPVTDRAIDIGRAGDHDRLIVHYLQPHAPYLSRRDDGGLETTHAEPLTALRRGELSRTTAWEAYLETLRIVLDDVEILLENIDAERVAITADHGEAFGEMGLYEHPVSCPHPVVKRVPWAETTATDHGIHQPDQWVESEDESRDIEEQLQALGYS